MSRRARAAPPPMPESHEDLLAIIHYGLVHRVPDPVEAARGWMTLSEGNIEYHRTIGRAIERALNRRGFQVTAITDDGSP